MRAFACSIMLLCCVSVAYGDDEISSKSPADEASTDSSITVEGREMALSYKGEQDGETIREFIPSDETLETWTRLAAIREYPELDNPHEFAKIVVKRLDDQDPPINYDLIENAKTGAAIIDFTVWSEDKSFAEFNVFLYRKQAEGGLASYQYAVRAYGDDAIEFFNGLDAEQRMKYVVATLQFAAEQNGDTQEQQSSEEAAKDGGASDDTTNKSDRSDATNDSDEDTTTNET
jgi:hypothetical protein